MLHHYALPSTPEEIGEIDEGVDISILLRLPEDGLLQGKIHHGIYLPVYLWSFPYSTFYLPGPIRKPVDSFPYFKVETRWIACK